MHSNTTHINGFGTLETLLALTLFASLATVLGTISFHLYESMQYGGQRMHAHHLAQEGVHALMLIRNTDVDSLASGTYGLVYTQGEWVLSDKPDNINQFIRTITVDEIEGDGFLATSSVSWGGMRGDTIAIPITLYDIFESHGASAYIACEDTTATWNTERTELNDMRCSNTDTESHTLTHLTMSWEGEAGLYEVAVASTTVFSVASSSAVESGTRIDIADTDIDAEGVVSVSGVRFTESVLGERVTLQVLLEDGTVRNGFYSIE